MAKLSSRAILPIIRRFAMHYDPKLLDNATQANSWSQVEIQSHSGSLFHARVAAIHLRTEVHREDVPHFARPVRK